jgi:carbonic anhydrase
VARLASALTLALLLAGLPGCEKIQALMGKAPEAAGSADPHAKPPEGKEVAHDKADKAEKADKEKDRKGDAHARTDSVPEKAEPVEYALPFAWEASAAEPLGRTRTFLRDMFQTNTDYMQIGTKLFPTYAEKQTPRATVLTCADSRVHTSAFDGSPENDDFLVRNIGNQVETSAGSVEYGVTELNTPLLVILGHTGCGAVRAAMDGPSKLDPAIQAEVAHIHPPKRDAKKDAKRPDKDLWVEAVVDNVHDQVDAALERFGKRVHSGRLTVVGAVLDFRNDIGLGAGRLVLVDVNGNRDPERIGAFIEAVTGRKTGKKDLLSKEEDKREEARSGKESAEELAEALASLIPAGKKTVKASAPRELPGAAHAEEHGNAGHGH